MSVIVTTTGTDGTRIERKLVSVKSVPVPAHVRALEASILEAARKDGEMRMAKFERLPESYRSAFLKA